MTADPRRASPSRATTRRVLLRYAAFQLPELLVFGTVVYAAHRWLGLSATLAWSFVAFWLAKEVVLFRVTRHAYEPDDGASDPLPKGAAAIARDGLSGEIGYVLIGPERWRARRAEGCPVIPPGERVRVVAVEGLTVVVDRDDGGAA